MKKILIYPFMDIITPHKDDESNSAINWYRTLTIHQRINLKDLSVTLCGIKYEFLIKLFGMKETIKLLYQKLKLEGFII